MCQSRNCTICKIEMLEGYVLNDGLDYYCSDDCLSNLTQDEHERNELYNADMLYYTEW